MKEKRVLLIALVVLLALGVTTTLALAQGPTGTRAGRSPRALLGTGFTYQGQLKNNGSVVNGTCDFRFGLWDSASVGSQIATTVTVPSVIVTNGLFTAPIDLGADAINGEARYLGIAVACPSGGSYTAFSSRQALTPAPIALALPGLYTQQNTVSPNIIGGYIGNSVTVGVQGATISGGGTSGYPNQVMDRFGTVSGGYLNKAGNGTGDLDDGRFATVGGGAENSALGQSGTIAGGFHNTATGGRNGGATVGGGAYNTASGYTSTIGGGECNTASGDFSTVSGGGHDYCWNVNIASGYYSTIPGGGGAIAPLYGQMSYASGAFSSTGSGDAQTSVYVLRNTTTDATVTSLYLDGSSQLLTIASGRTATFDILVVAQTSSGSSAGYRASGVIKNQAGSTAFIGSPAVTRLGEDVPTWDATVVADDANDALQIKVTGAAATTIRWVATIRTVEVSW